MDEVAAGTEGQFLTGRAAREDTRHYSDPDSTEKL